MKKSGDSALRVDGRLRKRLKTREFGATCVILRVFYSIFISISEGVDRRKENWCCYRL